MAPPFPPNRPPVADKFPPTCVTESGFEISDQATIDPPSPLVIAEAFRTAPKAMVFVTAGLY